MVYAAMATGGDIEDLGKIIAERSFDACECPDCASLCHGVPGMYDPDHVAQRLPEIADKLVEDMYFVPGVGTSVDVVLFLRPRTVAEPAGGQASIFYEASKCVFLKEGGCSLPRDEMPIGCISSFACRGSPSVDKDKVPHVWRTAAGEDTIRRFEEESTRRGFAEPLGDARARNQINSVARLGPLGPIIMMSALAEVENARVRAAEAIREGRTDNLSQ